METPELLWQDLVRESVREVRYGLRPEERGVIRLVDFVLGRAVAMHASDVHLEPQEMRVRLRFRVDGLLREVMAMPANLGPAVISRLKVMAGMDIAVHQQPQDGHILFQAKGRRIDIRVSSLPATAGEVIVMRLMDVSEQLLSLDELGFSKEDMACFRALIHRPAGMIVLCGPMNSGKTSSLYAALAELNTESRNLVTLEDPIERVLPGVNQVQIHPKAGMTFVAGLRAVLRQDVTGILLGATLSGIISQRLVRRLCPDCREMYRAAGGSEEAAFFGAGGEGFLLYRSRGCDACQGTGYRGRTALAEILVPGEAVREGILQKVPRREMAARARASGMRSLLEDGRAKAEAGITSWQEVRRVLYG